MAVKSTIWAWWHSYGKQPRLTPTNIHHFHTLSRKLNSTKTKNVTAPLPSINWLLSYFPPDPHNFPIHHDSHVTLPAPLLSDLLIKYELLHPPTSNVTRTQFSVPSPATWSKCRVAAQRVLPAWSLSKKKTSFTTREPSCPMRGTDKVNFNLSNIAPATQNEPHEWPASHLNKKFCACNEILTSRLQRWSASANKDHSTTFRRLFTNLAPASVETFSMRLCGQFCVEKNNISRIGYLPDCHEVRRVPRKAAFHLHKKSCACHWAAFCGTCWAAQTVTDCTELRLCSIATLLNWYLLYSTVSLPNSYSTYLWLHWTETGLYWSFTGCDSF